MLDVSRVLIVDDELSMREFLQILMQNEGHQVQVADTVTNGLKACALYDFDLVVTDLKLPDGSGLDVLKWVSEHRADTQVILLTAFATTQNAVEAMRLGAYDYQIKPVKVDEIRALTEKALEKASLLAENRELNARLAGRKFTSHIIAQSPKMRRVLQMAEKVAVGNTSVLLEGESGTGKELIARAIHNQSPRAQMRFVAVNCGAIPESLIESELFGHKAGSFTGAIKDRAGLFESANGGTLLLDEVGELPIAVQVKLLRVLQEKKVRRVGDDLERPIDVRILAATNRELEQMVSENEFREDLFYRLNVVNIKIPPLRERPEDVSLLAHTFLLKYGKEMKKEIKDFSREATVALNRYSFPGNVRELENYIQRGVTLATGKVLGVDDLPEQVIAKKQDALSDLLFFPDEGVDMEVHLQELERRYINEALRRSDGRKKRAATLLGLSFRSFRYRLQKLGLGDKDDSSPLQD